MDNTINFFFIDDQGSVQNDQKWLILGGILITVIDYHGLCRELRNLNESFLDKDIKEIKWSDLSAAIYIKEHKKTFAKNKSYSYLRGARVGDIKSFIKKFFNTLNKYNYQIILSVSNKNHFDISPSKKFLEFQIEDLMQRIQYEAQPTNSLSIFVHDSRSQKSDNLEVKNIYKSLLSNSRFVNDYKNIIDNLFIEDSHLNIGIQISDFIIGSIAGSLRQHQFAKKIYQDFLREKIRKSSAGNILGYGILPTGLTKNEEFKNYLKINLNIY